MDTPIIITQERHARSRSGIQQSEDCVYKCAISIYVWKMCFINPITPGQNSIPGYMVLKFSFYTE
jgi:hypothetical protein